MEFCPKCGMKLTPTRKKKGKKNTIVLSCPKCGYKKRAASPVVAVAKTIEHSPQELIAVIGKQEQKLRTLPTVRMECPKCGNRLAMCGRCKLEVAMSLQHSFSDAPNVTIRFENTPKTASPSHETFKYVSYSRWIFLTVRYRFIRSLLVIHSYLH